MSNYKTHLEIPYPEVERYADKNGLNIETAENFREARIAFFNELTMSLQTSSVINETRRKYLKEASFKKSERLSKRTKQQLLDAIAKKQKKEFIDAIPADTFEPVKVGLNNYEDKIRLAFGNLTFFFPREQASIVASELIKLGDHKTESKEGKEKC